MVNVECRKFFNLQQHKSETFQQSDGHVGCTGYAAIKPSASNFLPISELVKQPSSAAPTLKSNSTLLAFKEGRRRSIRDLITLKQHYQFTLFQSTHLASRV
jgi:hypothetical protein